MEYNPETDIVALDCRTEQILVEILKEQREGVRHTETEDVLHFERCRILGHLDAYEVQK